jgi:DNA-binding NarL/FixJ family response regulator
MMKEQAEGDLRILIADDHSLFREGLRGLLEERPGFAVVGEGADGRETLELVRELEPSLLLIDLQMPKVSGLEVLRQLGAAASGLRTIVLAAAIEKDQLEEAFRLGARGVILKEATTSLLLECIRAVLADKYWVMREAVSDLSTVRAGESSTGAPTPRSKNFGLTSREMEVLAAIVAGRANREIAAQFSISEQTVKHHVTKIFDKVGVYNRLELALFAIHHGLVGKS